MITKNVTTSINGNNNFQSINEKLFLIQKQRGNTQIETGDNYNIDHWQLCAK